MYKQRALRARPEARGAAAQGIPALAVGARRRAALAVALLLRHDVDEVDLDPGTDPIVRGDDMAIISLPVGEAAAAGLRVIKFINATTRAH